MSSQLRRAGLIALWAWVVFVVAGLGFYGILDDNPLTKLGQSHLALGLSVLVVQAGAVLALLAVLAGGLPIALAVVRFALRQRRRDVLLLLAVPPVFAVLLGLLFVGLVIMANTSAAPVAAGGFGLFLALIGFFLVAALASPAAASLAVVRSQVDEAWFRFARLPLAATVAAMALTVCAVVAWGVSANLEAPQAFHGALGLLGLNTALSWTGVLVGMALATVVGALAVGRSFAVQSRRNAAT
jgi:hypothetical protein